VSDLCDYKNCLEPAEVNGLCRLHYGQDMDERQADKDRIAELENDIDQYREIDKDHLKRIELLECEISMWRKHVPELEADLAKAKLSNAGMHKTIARMTHHNGVECVHGCFLHERCDLCEGETK